MHPVAVESAASVSPAQSSAHRGGRPVGIYLLDPASQPLIYGPEEQSTLARLADIRGPVVSKHDWRLYRDELAEAEVIFSGWGIPLLDEEFLAAAPRLKAVFYGAGTVRYFVTEAFWNRGILLTSAYAANAIPVAEYTLGTILLSLRQFWSRSAAARLGEGWGDHTREIPGSFRAVVGLVSFGAIARKTLEFLRMFDLSVLVYCPFLTDAEAARLGVKKVSLEQLFSAADVVSIHTPMLEETKGLINARLMRRLKAGATLINTSRGPVINQPDLLSVFAERQDLHAVLDVTDPEPPTADDPLFKLPNVTVTSHIAGSHGRDCHRLGHYVVEELKLYLAGRPPRWGISRQLAQKLA